MRIEYSQDLPYTPHMAHTHMHAYGVAVMLCNTLLCLRKCFVYLIRLVDHGCSHKQCDTVQQSVVKLIGNVMYTLTVQKASTTSSSSYTYSTQFTLATHVNYLPTSIIIHMVLLLAIMAHLVFMIL